MGSSIAELMKQGIYSIPIVFLDVETTGLSSATEKVVEVAFSRFERGKLVETKSSLINPGKSIPQNVTAIHGITDGMVRDAPTLESFYNQCKSFLDGTLVGAYNALFDKGFFQFHYPNDLPWFDPMIAAREIDPDKKNTLSAVCERYDINIDGDAHRAEHDAVCAGEAFFKLVESDKPCSEVLAWIERKRIEQWLKRLEKSKNGNRRS